MCSHHINRLAQAHSFHHYGYNGKVFPSPLATFTFCRMARIRMFEKIFIVVDVTERSLSSLKNHRRIIYIKYIDGTHPSTHSLLLPIMPSYKDIWCCARFSLIIVVIKLHEGEWKKSPGNLQTSTLLYARKELLPPLLYLSLLMYTWEAFAELPEYMRCQET